MRKVYQTKVHRASGNCMQAALASLFERDLNSVIDITQLDPEDWLKDFENWVTDNTDYSYSHLVNTNENRRISYKALRSMYALDGYFLAVVPSKTYLDGVTTHAVIIDRLGIVVHDPNPNEDWLHVNVVETYDLIYWFSFLPKIDFS